MMEHNEYAQDIAIDPTQLDVEWLNQPVLMLKYTTMLADAKHKADREKERLDIKQAMLSTKIRKKPSVYGIEKGTEKEINSAIETDKEYQEQVKKLRIAKHEAELLVGVVRAFDQRKKALENLVHLHGQNYFAGPKEPRNIDREWSKNARQSVARDKVKKKMGRRRTTK